jgi:hypothetical protein
MVTSPSATVDETGGKGNLVFTVSNDGKGQSGLLTGKTAFLPLIDNNAWPVGYVPVSFHYAYKILPTTSDPTDTVTFTGPTSDPIPATLAPNATFTITFGYQPDAENDTASPGVTVIQLIVGWSDTNGGAVINQPGTGTITVQDVTAQPEPSSLVLFGIGIAAMAGYGWRRSMA